MTKCNGCINIKEQNFPFFKEDSKVFIDQEGCGVEGGDNLEIHYCPVCGMNLN